MRELGTTGSRNEAIILGGGAGEEGGKKNQEKSNSLREGRTKSDIAFLMAFRSAVDFFKLDSWSDRAN